jgi:outer membrane receptor protein involved in Fe transport
VEILKGSQPALYGGTAVGGVIAVSTPAGAALGPGAHHEATVEAESYGTLSAAYSITRNTGRGSFSFAASTARLDGLSETDENDDNTKADGFFRTRFTAVQNRLSLLDNGAGEGLRGGGLHRPWNAVSGLAVARMTRRGTLTSARPASPRPANMGRRRSATTTIDVRERCTVVTANRTAFPLAKAEAFRRRSG